MFGSFFKKEIKSCKNCYYYDEYRTSDILNPDKTVTYGKVETIVCGKEREPFELTNFDPCHFWKIDTHDAYNRKSYAIYHQIKNCTPPKSK